MTLNFAQPLAGLLEPVFAIRTADDLGIGDTEGVRQMIDWCARHNLHVFQTLPINETSDDNSPYNPISALAIEPTTLAISPRHIPDLTSADFDSIARPRLLSELRRGGVNYRGVKALKRRLLEAAFANFLTQHFNRETRRAQEFRAFMTDHAEWLGDYTLFRALMEENGGQPAWEQWPPEHREPARARTWLLTLPEPRRESFMRRQLFFAYVQWLAFQQWAAVRDHAHARQVWLMGDLPFGVGRASADVWAYRPFFDLNWSGGAPPETAFQGDPFTVKWGQNWGVPDYCWDELRRQDFAWWRMRIGNLCKVFDLYRIDHVLGLFRLYAFPWPPERNAEFLELDPATAAARTGGRLPGFRPFPDDSPEHCAANQARGEALLRVLKDISGDTRIVAEDLGWVPDYVPATLHKLGLPGFRIPRFAREADGRYTDPLKYPRLSVAQPGTHDHEPLAAFWAGLWANVDAGENVEANRRELRAMMDFAGLADEPPPRQFDDRLHEGFLRAVLRSNSWLAIFQIADVFAQTDRINTPGVRSEANWSHRLPHTVEQLDAEPHLAARGWLVARSVEQTDRLPEPT